ncbi:YbgC/FadM family acyl-CoA thioesterase [Ideonella sp. 4Y16]|uniref:YbgC/FadM family acyl-CoA thioesterase n=1 Tax=Ideonella alba TaxID=2824118 RepID=UPI001B374EE8|nr:YbgC/FadM family acyl-CoA thioesterase [Ideonella alba]MBQ0942330.1 YbgC/FadM family acyl-CoA thioesterase [Ideonella alba]
MKRADFRFLDRQRVRWAEVDLQKIVFNGHYLMYMDTAVAGYWRALALPYHATMDALGGDLYVRKATLEYHASAEYDDAIETGIRCEQIGNSSMRWVSGVFRGEELLVSGELVYVFADPVAKKSLPVPPDLRRVLQGFEAGEAMVEVRVGTWDELGREAGAIRQQVFVQEQRIPADMEWDAADAACLHAVAFNRFGLPLATGRLLEHVPGVAKIGRMAVQRPMRGSQIGRHVLDALMAAARQRGDREVLLHAQTSAAGFYRRAGFVPRGPEFEEAGIAHIEMVCPL